MMEDIVGDYKDKTVTLEDFPYFDNNIKMATVHPCKHASVMKTLLDRADAALKIRREKQKKGQLVGKDSGMEGLIDNMSRTTINDKSKAGYEEGAKFGANDEWEVLPNDNADNEDEVAIRVDQYLIVFLKVRFHIRISLTKADSVKSSSLLSLQVSNTISPWVFKT